MTLATFAGGLVLLVRVRLTGGLACLACIACLACVSCSGPSPEASPPCDRTCQDRTALRAVRETMKLAYNITVQGKPEGTVDMTVPCLQGGKVRVSGRGSSNAQLGTTDVELAYDFEACGYLQKDTEPPENYSMTLTGKVTQLGTLSSAAGSTTALAIKSDKLVLTGTVYDPPIPFDEQACALDVMQNGGRIDGSFCSRPTGFAF